MSFFQGPQNNKKKMETISIDMVSVMMLSFCGVHATMFITNVVREWKEICAYFVGSVVITSFILEMCSEPIARAILCCVAAGTVVINVMKQIWPLPHIVSLVCRAIVILLYAVAMYAVCFICLAWDFGALQCAVMFCAAMGLCACYPVFKRYNAAPSFMLLGDLFGSMFLVLCDNRASEDGITRELTNWLPKCLLLCFSTIMDTSYEGFVMPNPQWIFRVFLLVNTLVVERWANGNGILILITEHTFWTSVLTLVVAAFITCTMPTLYTERLLAAYLFDWPGPKYPFGDYRSFMCHLPPITYLEYAVFRKLVQRKNARELDNMRGIVSEFVTLQTLQDAAMDVEHVGVFTVLFSSINYDHSSICCKFAEWIAMNHTDDMHRLFEHMPMKVVQDTCWSCWDADTLVALYDVPAGRAAIEEDFLSTVGAGRRALLEEVLNVYRWRHGLGHVWMSAVIRRRV